MDCVFCKIVKSEIPCHKIYENTDVLAFLDINPLTKGHCMVIPKKHCQDIFDISESDLQKVIVAAKRVSEKIKNTLKADGIRLSQSNGKAAGQEVMHFHLHVIPRYLNDGFSNNPTLTAHPPSANVYDLKKLAEEINSK